MIFLYENNLFIQFMKSWRCRIIILFILFLIYINSAIGQEVKRIEILNADITEFDNTLGNKASRLLGNVRFQHEDMLMSCDSAHYYPETNTLDAFSRVHIWREDSLHLYSDFLKYTGNNRKAQMRGNVKLIDKETTLTTRFIDYDLIEDIGYYHNGGNIINGNNNLTSTLGYYYAQEKLFFFRDSVVIVNPEYTMYSDTLKYNTVTEVAYFLGPTNIVSEENIIYCENGWYDTKNNISRFSLNASLKTGERTLAGDSLYYERDTGFGEAVNNVELIDTTQQIILKGNYGLYNEKTGYAMITQRALMIQIDKEDSLFVHADTLISVNDTIPDLRIIKAFYHVKIFRHDIQGKCDSLVYTDADSAFRFFGEPVLWSEENQLTAEHITIFTEERKLSKIILENSAFISSMEDSAKFNQIKGRDMHGYFQDNELVMIEVDGNGETLYYARDREELVGVNKAAGSNMVIFLENRKFNKILFVNRPDAIFYPIEKLPEKEALFENFKWYGEYRPLNKDDIFEWIR